MLFNARILFSFPEAQGWSEHNWNASSHSSVWLFFPAPFWPIHRVFQLFLICHQIRVTAPALISTGEKSRWHLTRMPWKNRDVRDPVLPAPFYPSTWALGWVTWPLTYSTNTWVFLMSSTTISTGDETISKANPARPLNYIKNKTNKQTKTGFNLWGIHLVHAPITPVRL